jgi:hypothetical protein
MINFEDHRSESFWSRWIVDLPAQIRDLKLRSLSNKAWYISSGSSSAYLAHLQIVTIRYFNLNSLQIMKTFTNNLSYLSLSLSLSQCVWYTQTHTHTPHIHMYTFGIRCFSYGVGIYFHWTMISITDN